jgi:serine phosphatase RsbU (regulator of sigma subunit)
MYESPKEILVNVNRMLYEGMERKSFITMIVALFDTERSEVRICRAGHHKAIMRTDGDLTYLDSRGIGLGLERGPLFESELEEIHRPLRPGALFVFYSDGLTEAMNAAEAEFGEENVFRIVRAGSQLPARALEQSIIAEARKFQGEAEQHDDMTVVVVRST